jgi:hypothetical protein
MTSECGGILIYNRSIPTITNHLYMHYNKNIATKQPKINNVCSRWVGKIMAYKSLK